MEIEIKRAYDPAARSDGTRILVDRMWPRGVRKDEAAIDLWLKDIAPSTPLRRWFGHREGKWDAFKERYFHELDAQPEALEQLRKAVRGGHVTLIYGAKETRYNNAVALREYLQRHRH